MLIFPEHCGGTVATSRQDFLLQALGISPRCYIAYPAILNDLGADALRFQALTIFQHILPLVLILAGSLHSQRAHGQLNRQRRALFRPEHRQFTLLCRAREFDSRQDTSSQDSQHAHWDEYHQEIGCHQPRPHGKIP